MFKLICIMYLLTMVAVADTSNSFSAAKITRGLKKITPQNWSPKLHSQLATAMADCKEWSDLDESLQTWLISNYDQTILLSQSWIALNTLQKWCHKFAKKPALLSELDDKTLKWLINDYKLSADLFRIITPQDDFDEVLCILASLHKKNPKFFPKFNRLAVAYAVVWDNPPSYKPHGQVSLSAVENPSCTLNERFEFWVESQKGGMSCDLTKLDPSLSVFVIDAGVPLSELRWAQEHIHFTQGRLKKIYATIKYDHDRLEEEVYSWPFESYTLKEIKRRGGICIDQAYYTSMAGKAAGIPTLTFSGSGRAGFHAWIGYLMKNGKWDMDCGRYENQKFVKGSALNPQTKQSISDHQLAFLAAESSNTKAHFSSDQAVDYAELLAQRNLYKKALKVTDYALKNNPDNLDAWNLKGAVLINSNAAYDDIKNHYFTMSKQFSKYDDIRVKAQSDLKAYSIKMGDTDTVAKINDKIIRQTRSDRHDLSLKLYKDEIFAAAKADNWKLAGRKMREAISKFRAEISDIYGLTSSYISYCIRAGQYNEADKTIRYFKSRTDYKDSVQLKSLVENLEKSIKQASRNSK